MGWETRERVYCAKCREVKLEDIREVKVLREEVPDEDPIVIWECEECRTKGE